MEIPLLRGRYFTASDLPGGEKVVLIDEKMANRFWSNQDPIGKRVRFSGSAENEWRKIVGVVGTVKQYGLDVDLRMVVYFPHTQFIVYSMYVVARTATDGRSISSAIIREIHAVDPGVPVYDVQTMQQRLRHSLARQRFTMLTIEAFSLFALMLSIVGVYGVVSYQVEQATREIGVRVALGAGRSDVLRLVLSQGLKLIGAGILLGLMGAFVFSRVMESLLFGVSATDAATFAMVVLILSVVALAASLVPAMRAARISPMAALRYE
jgi:putative ABC transport system permease protein